MTMSRFSARPMRRGLPNANWAMGDFDYNGFVDDDDVTLLGAFYQPPAAAALTLPSPEGRGVIEVAAPPLPAVKDENAAEEETIGLGLVRGQAFDELSSTLLAAGSRAETGAQQDNPAQRAKALTLPSPEGRGVSANRDDEILVDVLAEAIAAEAAPGTAGLRETGLALRRAVSDVWALWPG